jgi:hypothetical protein
MWIKLDPTPTAFPDQSLVGAEISARDGGSVIFQSGPPKDRRRRPLAMSPDSSARSVPVTGRRTPASRQLFQVTTAIGSERASSDIAGSLLACFKRRRRAGAARLVPTNSTVPISDVGGLGCDRSRWAATCLRH